MEMVSTDVTCMFVLAAISMNDRVWNKSVSIFKMFV